MINLKGPINSIFLIFLSLIGGVGFKLLGCPLQDLLQNNIWARQLSYFIVILFTTSFIGDDDHPPLIHLRNAFLVYVFLIVFTKMSVRFTVIVFFLILIIYVLHIYINYFKTKSNNNNNKDENQYYKNLINQLNSITMTLGVVIIIFVTIGFSSFVIYKKKQYGKKFNIIKFIFGVRDCKYQV